MRAITILDDEKFLRQVSKNVDLNDPVLDKDIKVLDDFCNECSTVMAMAAIQLGIPKRLVYLKNTNLDIINKKQRNETTVDEDNYNEARILINPVVTKREGLTDYWEACASCLNYFGHVRRPYRIYVDYYDVDGCKHSDIFEGFESTVLSHELDHLDGILHMDIADEVLIMAPDDRKVFRQTHGYNITSMDGDYEELMMQKAVIKR